MPPHHGRCQLVSIPNLATSPTPHADLPAYHQRAVKTARSQDGVRVALTLWFEDVTPINLEKCWGERVRRDLRVMKEDERRAWIALFGECVFSITAAPTKKWLKPAGAAFPKIGAAVFRKRFQEWFAPFAMAEALRLTVIGRNVLRMLIWSALIAEDPAVDEALAGFANAQWKTRENARCASQAEMAFAHVLAHRSPGKALPILEEMVRSGQACPGSAAQKTYKDLCEKAGRKPVRPDFR